MARTLTQVDTDLASLQSRVNLVDGQGLTSPAIGSAAGLQNQVNGLKTTLNQISMLTEQVVNDLTSRVAALEAAVKTITG